MKKIFWHILFISCLLFVFSFLLNVSYAQTPKCWVYSPLNPQVNVSTPVTVFYENMNFNVVSTKIECGDKTSNDETARCGKNTSGSCTDYCKYKKEGGPYTITAYVKGTKSSQKLNCTPTSVVVGNILKQPGGYTPPDVFWTCRDSDPNNDKNVYGEVQITSSASSFVLKDQCGAGDKSNIVIQFFCTKTSDKNNNALFSYSENPCASSEKCVAGRCVSLSDQKEEPPTNSTWPNLLENDLSIEEVLFEDNVKANTPLAFLIKVKNVGTKKITASFYYRIFDIKTNNTICSIKNTANVDPGQILPLSCSSAQGLAAGEYNLKAEVDFTNLVKKDINRSNNQKSFSIKIVEPAPPKETAPKQNITCNNNGIKEDGEECDGWDFGSESCQAKGFKGGSLSCQQCKISTSTCSNLSSSANNSCEVLDPGEIIKGQSKEISVKFKGFNPSRYFYRCKNNAEFIQANSKACSAGSSGICRFSCLYDTEGIQSFTTLLYTNNVLKAQCGKQIKVITEAIEAKNTEKTKNTEETGKTPTCEATEQCGYLYSPVTNECAQTCITSCNNPFAFKTQEQCENAYPVTKAEKQSFEVSLKSGWNQISVPISHPAILTRQLQGCKIQKIWGYDPARKNNEWLNPLTLSPIKGYFALVEEDCVLKFEGFRLPQTLTLSPGWNLISSKDSWKDLDPNDKCGISGKIYHLNPKKLIENPSGNAYDEIAPEESLDDTQGYWIYINNRCVITEPKL